MREVPDWEMQRNVTITGEVLYPGTYSLQRPDETVVSDHPRGRVQEHCLSESRDVHAAQGRRGASVGGRGAGSKGKKPDDVMLDEGDQIYIPRRFRGR